MSKRRLRGYLIIAGMVAVLAALAVGFLRRVYENRLHRLFLGEQVSSPGAPEGFYPRVQYDLSEYAVDPTHAPGTFSLPEGGAIDVTGGAFGSDARTGASRIARLVAPTDYKERIAPSFLTVTHPTERAVFPPNLCAPFVEWGDARNNLWQVTIEVPGAAAPRRFIAYTCRWRIPGALWREIVKTARTSDAVLQVRGVRRIGLWQKDGETVHVSQKVHFRVSEDAADNAIVYRLVTPPFINQKTPDSFVRDIRTLKTRPFVRAHRQYCINCHNFSSKTGREGKFGIQVRYLGTKKTHHRVYLAICDLETRRVTKTFLPFKLQMTTFMSWSPDGTKVVFAANQELWSVPPRVVEAQNTTQASGDIACYDLTAGQAFLLPGASDPRVLETFPRWTPDGGSIVYCASPLGLHPLATRFNLNVIPFNDGRGGSPRPVSGASNNGKSNIYPRFSPDGKWFSFVQTDGGSLIKSSSDIYLMPGDFSRAPRRLESNVPHAADSWYSWSSNSRWIVFATKRDDGVFARLYMTHIDDEGHASPAVRLPLAKEPLLTFNIPEFVANDPTIDERTLYEGVRVEREAVAVERAGEDRHEQSDR